jgi:hypothetical protein
MYYYAVSIMKISIIIAALASLYILCNVSYYKQRDKISAWQFPMLLAILIELYIFKMY